MYREQCIGMETELSQIREKGDVGREIFQVCSSIVLLQGALNFLFMVNVCLHSGTL